MSMLREVQSEFAAMVPRLIDRARDLGFEVTIGDAYRDPRVHGSIGTKLGYGHPRSGHKQRLAIDLNLFLNGEFLDSTEAHKELGSWWEKQHPLARWGGRFEDGNHYSFEWGGMK
jgi:hypothetical protein